MNIQIYDKLIIQLYIVTMIPFKLVFAYTTLSIIKTNAKLSRLKKNHDYHTEFSL
jgi:hypothetical protein